MGRKSQERITGRSHSERVARAKSSGIRRFINRILRFNKDPPRYYANTRRDGRPTINPRLTKRNQEVR